MGRAHMITDPIQATIGVLAVATVGTLALLTKTLDWQGFGVGVVVGLIVLFFGGWDGFATLLTFFVVAGFFTRYKYELKRKLGASEEWGGKRSWQNVVANGAVASTFIIAYGLTSMKPFACAYLGAIGTSAADTLGTEIGLLNPYEPRLITDLSRRVPAGTSGAISPYGEMASLVGAGVIASVAWFTGFTGLSSILNLFVGLFAGFLGSTFDSVLGATVQASFRCKVCGKMTERKTHCGLQATHAGGNRIFDNNVVNLFATALGGLSAGLASALLSL